MGNVSIGPTTVFSVVVAALTAAVPLVGELADAAAPLGISPEFWVKVSALIASLLIAGRYGQAIVAAYGEAKGVSPAVVAVAAGDETDVEVDGLASDPHLGGTE